MSSRFVKRATVGGFLIAVAAFFGLSRAQSAHAFPVPAATYSIDAFSGSHHASLLNLPVGQPGVVQAPIPVDVNGDLLPDIAVSLNLVQVNGFFNNPPNVGAVLAPNIQINRLPTAPILGQASPPLRIYITYTLHDSAGGPSTSIRFGYDTKNGGSIPTFFSATLGGLSNFFNPLEAVVDTTGGPLGLHTGVNMLGLGEVAAPYQGPLTLVAGFTQSPTNADIELQYKPFPQVVDVTYGTDHSGGQHITYAHGLHSDVGLTTALKLTTSTGVTNVVARVDRLPRSIALDITGGSLDYRAVNDGRPPDAHVVVGSNPTGQRPLNATVDIESIPSQMHAEWSLPTGGPAHAAFTGAGQGIGAIEADVTNYATSSAIPGYVPDQIQYLNLQQVGGDMHISGRVEKVRGVSFTQSAAGGVDATAALGDGELPLLAHVTHDDRVTTTLPVTGHLLEASATMTPLPDSAEIAFAPPTDPTTQPMLVTYKASQSVNVDGTFKLFNADAGPTCGTHGTICASLKARHLPTSITASIENFPTESHIDLTAIPRVGGQSPDFFADATLGQSDPTLDDYPLIAHAELLRLPQYVRIFTHDGIDQTLDKAEFHACDWDFTALACRTGTDQPVGSLAFSLHNWTSRPANLPAPAPTTSQFATMTARGGTDPTKVRFEAAGKVLSIDEVDYRNTGGIFGVRTKVGGGNDFSTHVDLGDIDFKPSDPTQHRFDVLGDATVISLPAAMDFCFRQSGQPIAAPSGSFTAPCEAADPFGDGTSLPKSPLSVAYRASAPFNVNTSVAITDRGANDSSPADDHVIKGVLNVTDLPSDLTLHLQTPGSGETGKIRALYCAGSGAPSDPTSCPTTATGDKQPTIDFAAQSTDAQLVCKDPRIGSSGPQIGQEALCARARLENLPNRAVLIYDPTQLTNNFSLTTSGQNPMNLTGFGGNPSPPDCSSLATIPNCAEVSAVTVDAKGNPQYLVGDLNITGLPKSLVGTLNLPNTVDLSTTDNPISDITASVRNFVAPDPTPTSIAGQRTDLHGTALPNPDEQFVFLQRGSSFKAAGHVTDLHRVGYTTVVSSDPGPTHGTPLDTKIINVDFGTTKNIRAYADLNDGTNQLNGDVTLTDVPSGIQVCFRGAKTLVGTPNIQTFCDAGAANGGPSDSQGGFQFVGHNGVSLAGLGLHAFFRQASAGGTAVLSGAADISGIPPVVQGTFGSGQAKAGGFGALNSNGVGITPQGIDNITAELANADLAVTGYGNNPPWDGFVQTTLAPFAPVPATGQYVRLALNDTNFHVQASIDKLQGVTFDNHACPKPASSGTYTSPPDYPYFPTLPNGSNPSPTYTCVRADFTTPQTDPLALYAVVDHGATHIALHDAGLSNIPSFIQANLTTAPTADQTTTALFRPCGSAAVEPAGTTDCVAPMIRVDTPGNAKLFGVVELGNQNDLNTLSTIVARDPNLAPALDATPTATTWSAGPNTNGVRVKVGTGGTSPAVRAAVQIPVPKSLTIDQFQSFDCSGPDHSGQPDQCKAQADTQDDYWQASDLRFHYVLRGTDNLPQSPGELTALIAGLTDGGQTIVSDPNTPDHGITIPGELGLGIYLRDYKGKGQKFIQLDGRTSSALSAKAQILSGQGDSAMGITAQILNVPAIDPSDSRFSDPLFPSFRLRAQLEGDGQKPPSMGGGGGLTPVEQALLCVVFCIKTQVHVQSIDANFNFNPQGGSNPARLVTAVVNQAGSTKNGVEVRGNSAVDGSGTAAPVAGGANIIIDPLNIFFHVGIPVVADFDFIMMSDISAGAHIGYTGATPPPNPQGTSDFWLRENLLNVAADNQGPGPSELSITINIHQFHALLFSIFGFLPFLGGNPVLLGIDFLPPSPPPLLIDYRDCAEAGFGAHAQAIFNADPTMSNPSSFVAWPLDDPRFIFYGTLGTAVNVLFRFLGAPLLCAFSAPSASDLPLVDSTHPGVPLDPLVSAEQDDLMKFHPVPPNLVPFTPPTPAPPPQQTLSALNVPAGTTSLCGDKNYSGVDISGTLQVATVASGTDCPAGSEGRLHIVVTRNDPALDPSTANTGDFVVESGGQLYARGTSGEVGVVAGGINIKAGGSIVGGTGRVDLTTADPNKSLLIAGSVTADGASGGVGPAPASGNGGAGHGGAGGNGVQSTSVQGGGGGTYGNTSLARDTSSTGDGTIITETGAVGSTVGSFRGAGGGQIALIGQTVRISGTLSANGTVGGNGNEAGPCSAPTVAVPGSGGGSGGDITISATKIDATGGTVAAHGGGGGFGYGGGGGGGGGIISTVAPVTLNYTPDVGAGAGGASLCDLAPEGQGGHGRGFDGSAGATPHNNNPASRAESTPNRYWFNGTSVPVPITAAAAETSTSHNFQVVLCGMNRPPSAGDPDSMGHTPSDLGFVMPTGYGFLTFSWDNPCGSGGTQLAEHDYSGTSQSAVGDTLTATGLGNGYEALWTTVLKSDTDSVSCLGAGLGGIGHCFVEGFPSKPESIIGVDNNAPQAFALSASPTVTNDPNITLHVTGVKDVQGHIHDDPNQPERTFSGVNAVDCSNDNVTFTPCDPVGDGDRAWTVTSGSGSKTIYVRVTDNAGNITTENVAVTLDAAGPSVHAAPDSAPDRSNGWYSASPSFTINWSKPLPPPFMAGPGTPPIRYHFDGAPPQDCTIDGLGNCHITTGLPLHGIHTLFYQGFDAVGNVSAVQQLPIKIDGTPPQSALLAVPDKADGANGWNVTSTFFTVSALDEPGGSGLIPGATDTKGAGVYISTDGAPFPTTAATPPVATIPLGEGNHTVCWYVQDVAGNLDLGGHGFVPTLAQANAAHQCKSVMVDTAKPAVSIVPNPAAPGSSGWYTTPVAVTLVANDGVNGSGVNPLFDPADMNQLCSPNPKTTDPRPSGVCVSIDNAPFVPYAGLFTIPEGVHDVRAFAIDVAGNRSNTVDLPISVDLSAPVASARTRPPDPALGPWFRTLPVVVLRAVDGDQNSGVAHIQYRLDGGPTTTYTGPFTVPESPPVPRTVIYWATDNAGLVQKVQTLTLDVDQTPPTAMADSPIPALWLQLLDIVGNLLGLSPPQAQLTWTVSDNTSPHVQVKVLVYNALGAVVRELPVKTVSTSPNVPVTGFTSWDGTDQTLTGLVPVGLYYYRVVAIDDAGNRAQSGESRPIQIRAGLPTLTLPGGIIIHIRIDLSGL